MMLLQTLAALAFAAATSPTLSLAVETADAELAAALDYGPMQRWVLPRRHDLRLEIGADMQDADVLVQACRLPSSDDLLDRLARQLDGVPAALYSDGFELGAESYRGQSLAVAVRVPGTRRWVACGADPELTAGVVQRVLILEAGAWRVEAFDYLVYEHPHSQRSGLWQKTSAGVTLDPDERNDFRSREQAYASMWSLERAHLVLRAPASARRDPRAVELAGQLADDLDSALVRMVRRLGADPRAKLEVLIENDHVEQGRHTGAIDPAVLFGRRVHLVYHPNDTDFYRFVAARALIRRASYLPRDLPPALEQGAALWLAGRWYGKPFAEWLPPLAFADVLPSAEEIAAAESSGDASRMIFAPAVAWALDQLPGETLLAKLRGQPAEELAGVLAKVLEEAAEQTDKEADKEAPPETSRSAPARPELASRGPHHVDLPFQRGVSFAMANGLEVGYHAPGVDQQLERMRAMGSDAVSLMPFAYQPRANGPGMSFLNRSPSSETDVGAVHAARRADEHGFFVLWKPHIWLSFDSWPGDIAMRSEADWAAWFRAYRRYMVHHAMLAEFSGAELFSVGVELGQTVEREAQWRHLIASVRGVYGGPLTYAGNWWGDYDRVTFWDALDVAGVDAYFPLAGDEGASDEQLRQGARRVVARLAEDARRFGRPILLTEVGFAARRGAWISPHEEGGEISDEHQERAWAALLAELGRPHWLRGLYAWKVFSHNSAERATQPDFRFYGRPARAQLERYFRGDGDRRSGATTTP